MSILRAIAVFLCGFLSLRMCKAQVAFVGPCPNVQVIQNFELNRYLGKWYEYAKYFFIFEIDSKCVTGNYGYHENNGTITVRNVLQNVLTGMKSEIKGVAQVTNINEGKLSLRFPSLPVNVSYSYSVVATDYDNSALVWSCNNFGMLHTGVAWILTRKRFPDNSAINYAFNAADQNRISRAYFIKTDQSDCPDDF